jgi:hypothetical protein
VKTSATTSLLALLFIYLLCQLPTARAQQEKKEQGPLPPITIRKEQAPPPPLPKIPDIRQPGEKGWWVGLSMWFPTEHPTLDKGHAADWTDPSKTTFQGTPKHAEGADFGLALGLHNSLRFSYFQTRAAGNFTTAGYDRIFSQEYNPGDVVSTNYRIQSGKISFDYLTWPYPVETRKFRLRTLWGVSYTGIRTSFNAPLKPLFDSSGNSLIDPNTGNAVDYTTSGSRWVLLPALGIGTAYHPSRNFRFEANASGFAVPHHSTVWDADATANIRFGHWELRLGGKAFHFKTSTKSDFFMKGTLAAPFVGLRWYSD